MAREINFSVGVPWFEPMSLTTGTCYISLHTGSPEQDEDTDSPPSTRWSRGSGLLFTDAPTITVSSVISELSAGRRDNFDGDEVGYDDEGTGAGDPLAEVRGSSYDQTLAEIDARLRGE